METVHPLVLTSTASSSGAMTGPSPAGIPWTKHGRLFSPGFLVREFEEEASSKRVGTVISFAFELEFL